MMVGISHIVTNALAKVIAPNDSRSAKEVLDTATNGQWRVWQKIGWGPSETRSTTETVMLAHVCLGNYQGGREFTFMCSSQSLELTKPICQKSVSKCSKSCSMLLQNY